LPAVIEDAIVAKRKELLELGCDAGAATIHYWLGRGGTVRPPSEATIWRTLVRRGFVVPQPAKRPKSSLRRFEADWPNERWQLDHTDWELAGGRVVQILNILDDHSRLCVAAVAAPTITSSVLWEAFSAAGGCYGLPSSCLSDNGLVFSGKLRGFEVAFEIALREAGIRAITSAPFHPQTCGKVERFQQTEKKWLRARWRKLKTIGDAQSALDEFRPYYNELRPHRGIGRITPFQRWSATAASGPVDGPLPAPIRRSTVTVSSTGAVNVRKWTVNVGVEYEGRPAQVVLDDTQASIYIDGLLIRHLKIEKAKRYQGSGRARGGARRSRR
jgi:transposase InsO family protein